MTKSPCFRMGGAKEGRLMPSSGTFPWMCEKHLPDAVFDVCRIGILGTGFLQGEADMFTTPWDAWPVDQVVRNILG